MNGWKYTQFWLSGLFYYITITKVDACLDKGTKRLRSGIKNKVSNQNNFLD